MYKLMIYKLLCIMMNFIHINFNIQVQKKRITHRAIRFLFIVRFPNLIVDPYDILTSIANIAYSVAV